MPTVGSLFSGIGGLDLGLERAGWTVRWQVENDPFCQRVLAKHWPDVPRYGDIREVDWDGMERVDLLAGGFPCQDISRVGRRAGIDGPKSGLWAEFHRTVRALRPRYVLVENTTSLLARGLGRVVGDLAALGYDAEWDCLPAAAVGAPHIRDRFYLLAYPGGGRHASPHQTVFAGWTRAQLHAGWMSEPRVGRVADGVPAFLDRCGGRVDAHESCLQKARTAGVPHLATLRAMRGDAERATPPPEPPGCALCAVPLPVVPHHRRPGVWEVGTWEEATEGVRHLREGVHELYAFAREAVQPGVSVGGWQEERIETVARRVDRLRGLGNAVVPQVAEWLGHRLLEVM